VPEPAIHSVRRILRVCLSLAIVTGISLAEFRLGRVNHTTVALTLLLAVLAIATWWGLLESLVASLAGMLCFNYLFLPPVGAWTIADPQNWVALITFVGTATVASQLSASAKRRAAAQARAEESASRAEAARQSEEMKSAMLDALAHEFKTPLTSIKAAVSSLLGDASAAPAHKEQKNTFP
jgi:two-component system sensor histidine kinase KdpD